MLKTEESRRKTFLIGSAILLGWNFLFYIPFVFSFVVWLPLFLFAALTAWISYRKRTVVSKVLWVIAGVIRWFALGWGVFELLSIGYDAPSRWDLVTKVVLIAYTIATAFLPTMALSVYRHKGKSEGKWATLCAGFALFSGLISFGVEPFKVGTVNHITDAISLPTVVTGILCVLTALYIAAVFVSSIFALPADEPKEEQKKAAK